MVGVVAGASAGWTIGSPIKGRGSGGGARTGGTTGACAGNSGCGCIWSFAGCATAVFLVFLRVEVETPKVRFREEPVFLALVLGFPAFASGETGAEAISTLKMGSPSSWIYFRCKIFIGKLQRFSAQSAIKELNCI